MFLIVLFSRLLINTCNVLVTIHFLCDVQSCSRVGSFLIAINNYHMEIESKEKEKACTSKKAKWNVSRKMVMDPKPLKDMLQSKCFTFPKSV